MNLTAVFVSTLAGLLVGGGWWLYTDAVIAVHQEPGNATFEAVWVGPGVVSTGSMVLLNLISIEQVRSQWEARLWLFVMLTIGFLGMGGAVWILSQHFGGTEWPGVALVLQSTLIVLGGIMYFLRLGLRGAGSAGVWNV